mgnify:CR=1 FL=1
MYNKTDGLIEQHIHGAFGVDFTDCSPDDLLYAANELAKCGITYFFPTLVTNDTGKIKAQIKNIKIAMLKQKYGMSEIAGIHLEGPFINPEKKGVHKEEYILPLKIELFDEIFDDVSDTQDTSPSKGKIVACVNNGYVNSDINGGGIAGFAGVDPDSQSDFEVVSGGQVSLKYTRTKQATITHCKNYGEVDVRNSYAGGIVARMETGAVIASENYGMIMTSDGDYTGGIAGYAANVIRDSYSMETLSGNDYIGGIAGLAEKLYNNKSMSEIEGDGERYGALAGMLEDDDNAEASGNIYVDYGRAAINGFTMSSQAKEVSYDELARMEDTPDDFGIMRVSFMDGDKRIAVIKRPYGGSISIDELPELPSEDGKLAIWDISGLDDIRQNIVVRASYVMPVTTIASDEPFPTMLVSGNFYKGSSILYEKYSAEGKDAEEPYECVDKYLFKINSSYGTADDNYTVRVRADSYKNWYKVATVQDGKIVPVPTGWDGKYMVFSMKGDGVFYIVRNKKHYIPCITAGIAILVLIVAVCIFRGLKK